MNMNGKALKKAKHATDVFDSTADNEDLSQPMEGVVFNMNELLTILDELWPLEEPRTGIIKRKNHSSS